MSQRVRVHLIIPAGRVWLPPGEYIVGRAPECHIVLASTRASRRHARIVVDEYGVSVEDLGSVNGVFVNGTQLVHERRELFADDFVAIGDQPIELSVEELPVTDASDVHAPVPSSGPSTIPPHAVTTKASGLELLKSVADRALTDGHPERAELMLEDWLQKTLRAARSGQPSEPHLNELALKFALDLAVALRSARWIDYSLQLMSELGRPMSAALAKDLGKAIEIVRAAGS